MAIPTRTKHTHIQYVPQQAYTQKDIHSLTHCTTQSLSARSHLGDVDPRPEELQVLPHLFWLVFGVQDGQLSEHAHVCPLLTQAGFHEGDDLLEEAPVLVVVDEFVQLVGVDNDVQAAHLCQTELPTIHAGEANL